MSHAPKLNKYRSNHKHNANTKKMILKKKILLWKTRYQNHKKEKFQILRFPVKKYSPSYNRPSQIKYFHTTCIKLVMQFQPLTLDIVHCTRYALCWQYSILYFMEYTLCTMQTLCTMYIFTHTQNVHLASPSSQCLPESASPGCQWIFSQRTLSKVPVLTLWCF